MNDAVLPARSPGFWRTVRLLLGAARRRAIQRQKRQQELLQYRTRKRALFDWSALGYVLTFFMMAVLNGMGAVLIYFAVVSGERLEVEKGGKTVATDWFIDQVRLLETQENKTPATLEPLVTEEARRTVEEHGGSKSNLTAKLRRIALGQGAAGFIPESKAAPGIDALPREGAFPAMLGSLILFWWCVMIVFQGEGLELDLQRRRHPMWEWLFSHPVTSGAVFMAEMLSPIAANPIYATAPVFAGVLYAFIYGPGLGALAAFLVGIPVAIAAACLGKPAARSRFRSAFSSRGASRASRSPPRSPSASGGRSRA